MRAYICDRCKTVIIEVTKITLRPPKAAHVVYDLCPECATAVEEYCKGANA